MRFDNGPHVTVHIEIFNGAMISSRLSLSDSFTCDCPDQTLLHWLECYSKGLHLELPLVTGTTFQQTVLQSMQKIPFGKTISYSELGSLAGSPQAARAVGNACNRNPFPLFIPCHRVIRSNGELGGFAYDLEIKRRLLKFEASRKDLPQQ